MNAGAPRPLGPVASVDAELRQLAMLRWATGAICFARTLPIVLVSVHYIGMPSSGGLPQMTHQGLQVLALIVAATVGFAGPVTLPLLMFAYRAFDNQMQTESLGTDVLLLLLGLFWITGAGARYSVDALALRRLGPAGAPIRWMYRLVRIPGADQLPAIYLLYFGGYAVMSFGAALLHLDDPLWQSGSAVRILFTSSYLSRLWSVFREVEAAWPAVLQGFSVAASTGQIAFQLLMFPLVWFRWGARCVVGWGALFFGVSLLILQLSYLPLLEIVLWIALFRRPRSADPSRETLFAAFRRSAIASRAIVAAGAVVLAIFAATVPYVDDWWGRDVEPVRRGLRMLGLNVPQVFNRQDLRMSDAWPILYRREPGGAVLVPFHGHHGERLAWVQWNDLLYFGNSLRWRREFDGPASLQRSSDSFERVVHVALFDHRRRNAAESRYTILYVATDGSDPSLSVATRFARRLLGGDAITCTGAGEAARCE